jgi:hypothetical protein
VTSQAQAATLIAQDGATLEWSWRVGRAETLLTAACMASKGFQYALPVPDPEPDPGTTTVDTVGNGATPTYGVFPPRNPPASAGDDGEPFRSALDGPSTAMAEMKLPDGSTVGYETGGCIAQARTTLFGSVRAYVASSYLPQVVREQFEATLATDGPYLAALSAWRPCMAGGHWTFDSPATAISSLRTAQLDAAALTERQAAIAGADRDCDAVSHLRARRADALTRFTAGLSGPLLADLDQVYAGRQQAGTVAARTVSS